MKSKDAMTVDRVLSRYGMASRTTARMAIRAGRIKVNGRVIHDPELWIRPSQDVLHLDGRRLKPVRKVYFLFYKPKGVITSHGDPQNRKTIYDYLGDDLRWVFPIGRLDKDTSGLLLLTNDTEFANFITDSDSGIPKTYLVKLNALMPDITLATLTGSVQMKRGDWAKPQAVRRVEDRGKYSWLEIVLTEGKNREVRRMMEAVGFTVLKLVRTQIGALTLQGLQVGEWRKLIPHEVSKLKTYRSATAPARKILTATDPSALPFQ